MKNTYQSLVGLSLALAPVVMAQDAPATAPAASPAPTAAAPALPTPTAAEVKKVVSYIVGFQIGVEMSDMHPNMTVADVKKERFLQAFTDSFTGKLDESVAAKDIGVYMDTFGTMMSNRSAEKKVDLPAAAPSEAEVVDFFNYFVGYRLGQFLPSMFNSVKLDDIDQNDIFAGFTDGLTRKPSAEMETINVDAAMSMFEQEMRQRSAQQGESNLKTGQAFLAENAKKEGVVTLPSGLQYKVLTAGTGRKYDPATDGKSPIAKVMYQGRLIDGTIFDESAQPVEFPLDQVVPGFSEALGLMPVGSEWEVYMPSNLAYGENGPATIGSNSTLIFKMQLLDLAPSRGTKGNPIELTPELEAQLRAQGIVPVTE
ncbi:MAG: FKBP-type peptidyl-prolyl cis-trans isomerase N-terminal domain-containing protein [Akkermansia sp.]